MKLIKERREELGLTAKYVAKELGVSSSTYFEWEQGREIKGEHYYLPLCRILKLGLCELISGQKSESVVMESLRIIEEHIKIIRSHHE